MTPFRSLRWLAPLAPLALCALLLAGTNLTALAAAKDEPAKVEVGKTAPDIELEATSINKVLPDKKDAKTLSLKDFKGKKNVVLFFYPKAMTPGCTLESCGFRDRIKKFTDLDTVVLGISTDKLADQQKFTEKENLTFPLLADPEKKVTKEYGALSPRGYASRYTYVIDKNGVVRKVYHTVNPGKHPDEVLAYIKENLTGK
jgi:peroxiredoxin Q/BCP